MASIDKATKANRLVTGRRFGNVGNVVNNTQVNDNLEPFTSTLDINSKEIYTQAHLIPSGSPDTAIHNIPFSGSSQNGYYLLADGTINDGTAGQPENALLRYWFRHKMTETIADNQTVWFFMNPAGATEVDGDLADPKILSDKHVTNFISNKYITGSLAYDRVAESTVPGTVGYNIRAFYRPAGSTTPPAQLTTTFIPADNFAFDYKTGVLTITNFSNIPDTLSGEGIEVYVTAYQYVGKTLNRTLSDLQSAIDNFDGTGGGGSGNYISSSNANNIVSASNEGILVQGNYTSAPVTIANLSTISASFGVSVVANAGFTGSLQGTGSWAQVAVSASITDNTATNSSYYPVFVSAAGNQGLNIDTATLSYNPSTNILTTTASNAFTASNITNAFVGNVAPNNQILISTGTGQVTGSSLFSFNPTVDGGQLIAGGVTLDQNSFTNTGNQFTYNFGNTPNAIQITNAGDPTLATITFNITASFTAPSTFVNAINSTFDDQFILLASGSANQPGGGNLDSGIIFEYGNTVGTGSAFFFDTNSKRLGFKYSASIANTSIGPSAFINMTYVYGVDGINSTTDVDTKFDQAGGNSTDAAKASGLMFIDANGNIYIKA